MQNLAGMESERRRTLVRATLFAVLVIALLVGGGVYVRVLIARSFRTASELATTRAAAYTALKLMLDEETGVRGYAATGDPLFLDPYKEALAPFPAAAAQLRADVADIFDPGRHRRRRHHRRQRRVSAHGRGSADRKPLCRHRRR